MTGSRYFAEALRGYGVGHVFFVPSSMLQALAEMEGMPIKRVAVHTEKAACYMADGYARASGRPGVCMAQSVGAANMAAGLKDAHLACSPVIAVTGGADQKARYRNSYLRVPERAVALRTAFAAGRPAVIDAISDISVLGPPAWTP